FCNHFLRTMAKGAGSHGGRRRLYPFFPEKPGLMATSQTWTTSEKVRNRIGHDPSRVLNLLPPVLESVRGFHHSARQRSRKSDIKCIDGRAGQGRGRRG